MNKYELVGYFSSKDRTSNLSLGIVEIDENKLTGSMRDEYLLALAKAQFAGEIAKEIKRNNGGTLTKVVAHNKGKADSGSNKSEKSGGSGIGKWLLNQVKKPYKG